MPRRKPARGSSAELRELEAARDQLHTDVDNLERHLEEQRDRVRLTTRELQRLLDDPAALREVAMPVLGRRRRAADPVARGGAGARARSTTSTPSPRRSDLELEPRIRRRGRPMTMHGRTRTSPPAAPPPSPAYADARRDAGPDTEAVDMLAQRDADDDAYLAELRKAMTDESPLGPREDEDGCRSTTAEEQPRSRFGRRR